MILTYTIYFLIRLSIKEDIIRFYDHLYLFKTIDNKNFNVKI